MPSTPPLTESARRQVQATRWLAVGSLMGLILLTFAWEIWLAPLRPDGSWLVLKSLPLFLPLAGLLKNRMYTYRWVSLVVWLYFMEGVIRAHGDPWPSNAYAGLEIALCLVLFTACAMHVRLRLRHAAFAAANNPDPEPSALAETASASDAQPGLPGSSENLRV